MGHLPQRRPTPARRRRKQREAHRRHLVLGRGLPQSRSRNALRVDPRRELLGHQGAPGRDLQDGCQHDKGENTGGDPQDVQHKERLHGFGGGTSAQGERMV